MRVETIQQEEYGFDNFVVSSDFLFTNPGLERKIAQQKFIDKLLLEHPSESVEDVSAVVHETNRIPDSRILIVEDGRILRLDRIDVDVSIEKNSYLGRLEYSAFESIKKWANSKTSGAEVWFSAPFPEGVPSEKQIYPASKIDAGIIDYSSDRTVKILVKKAILLDVDSAVLLTLANDFADLIGINRFTSAEELRSKPVFCTESELELFFDLASVYTDQIHQVRDGTDLEQKINTYQKLTIMDQTIYRSGMTNKSGYYDLRRIAEQEKMIGDKSESCPAGSQTAFAAFSAGSENIGVKTLNCTCPSCEQKVTALIYSGEIHCPNCGATAPYVC